MPFTSGRIFPATGSGRAIAALLALAALTAGAARADGLGALDSYIRQTHAGYAEFTQSVSNVNKSGAVRKSTGTFAFKRPSQFRFDYRKPYAQTIVADGKTLWMHDADLNQVTQRRQSRVLDATPAALVASATSIDSLKSRFVLENEPDKDGLEWVKATPKDKEGQLRDVHIGFEAGQLRKLEMLDGFGQRSVIEFGKFSPVPAAVKFSFATPKGATVLRQ